MTQLRTFPASELDINHFDVQAALREMDEIQAKLLIVALNNQEWGAICFLKTDEERAIVQELTFFCDRILLGDVPSVQEWGELHKRSTAVFRAMTPSENWLECAPERYTMHGIAAITCRRQWDAKTFLHLIIEAGLAAGVHHLDEPFEHLYNFFPEIV